MTAIAKGKNYWKIPDIYPEIIRNMTIRMLKIESNEWPSAEEAVIEFENYFKENGITFETLGIKIPNFTLLID